MIADQALSFIQNDDTTPYNDFLDTCLEVGSTPIMEWCSRKQRIVIDHPHDALIVTGVRENESGAYWPRQKVEELCNSFGIPLVGTWADDDFDNVDQLFEAISAKEGEEGVVVCWPSGDMVKVKTDWYRDLHSSQSKFTQERHVWILVLEGRADDAKPTLSAATCDQLDDFSTKLLNKVTAIENKVTADVVAWIEEHGMSDASKFIKECVSKADIMLMPVYFVGFKKGPDKIGPAVLLQLIIGKFSTASKLESMRSLVNLRW